MTLTNPSLVGILIAVLLLSRPGRRVLGAAVTLALRVAVIGAGTVIAYAAMEIIRTRTPVLVPLPPDMRLLASVATVAVAAFVCTMRLQRQNIGGE